MKKLTFLLLMFIASISILKAQPTTAPAAPTEDAAYVVSVYSEAYVTNIATNTNPNWGQATVVTEETIDGNTVLKYAGLNYQGTDYTTTDVSGFEYFHLDYWTSNSTSLDIYVIKAGSTEVAKSLTVTTGSWQSVDIPLSDFAGVDLTGANQLKIVGNGDVYFDNFYFWKNAPAIDVSLSDLTLDGTTITGFNSNITSYFVGLVDGTTVPTVAATPTDVSASVSVTQSSASLPDTAFVVVTGSDGTTKDTVIVAFAYTIPASAAPTPPAREVGDSISIFCNASNDLAGTTWDANWGETTVQSIIDIAGNSTMSYENFNFQGINFASAFDATHMEYLHVDMWTSDATVVKVTPISGGEFLVALDPIVQGQWNSYDIPIGDFTGLTLNNIGQFKFDGQDGVNPSNVYIDNIYFWKQPTLIDVTLSDLTLDATTITGFNKNKTEYSVGLVNGTTVPTVAATTTDVAASTIITQAGSNLPDTAIIAITGSDGTTKDTVRVIFNYTIPEVAAPTPPARLTGDSISIFCNASNDLSGTSWDANWGETTLQSIVDIAGNSTMRYENFNFQGINFASGFDATDMKYLHVDLWTNDATVVKVTPISGGEFLVALDPIVQGQWNSYDIPISDFTGVTLNNITQFKFDGQAGVTPSNVHLDNIYFWKPSLVADATLSDLTVGGTTVSGFASGTLNYSVILADGAAIPTVAATATNDGKATVTITQATGSLPATATIVVESEDKSVTNTYTIKFDIAPSAVYCDDVVTHFNIPGETASSIYLTIETIDETSIFVQIESADADPVDELIVNNGSGATISAKDESVPGKIKRTLTWTTKPDSASIELLWSKVSNAGNWMLNTFKVHTGAVCRVSTDATLSDLSLSEGTLSPAFDAATETYAVLLPFGSDVPTVTTSTTDNKANAVVTNATALPGSTTIVVTAEDGSTTKTYTINFTVGAASTDATLSAIALSEGTLSPAFDAATETYSVLLPIGSSIPTVTATTTDANADTTVTSATSLPGTTTVLVTAQDGSTTKTYTINFTLEQSTVSSLNDLKVDDVTIQGFKADSTEYEYEVPFGTTIFPVVTYTVTDANAQATVVKATVTTKTDTVKVTAQDGSITKYLVKYVYAAPSTDATLSDIALDGTTISGFKSDSLIYPVELPFGTSVVPVVSSSSTHDSATVVITQAATLTDTAIVVVTAQDGTTTNTYKVSFTVAAFVSTDATLQNIKVNSVALVDFAADKYVYIAELPFGTVEAPTVTGVKNNLAATVAMDTAKTLTDTAVITVTAQDGVTVLVYKVMFKVSEPVYDVSFVVSDGTKALLQGATVSFMLDTLFTDINGTATFTQVSVTTDAPYSVTLEGYEDVTGTLSVVDANVTKEIVMNLIAFDVKFNVVDANSKAIAGAMVVFQNDTLTTDSTGLAIFKSVVPVTDAAYSISKAGYFATSGTLSVVDAEVVQNITLELEVYDVTFAVIGVDSLPIAVAEVVFNNDTIKTDSSGIALFESVVPNVAKSGAYAYSVSKDGYFTAKDSVSVVDSAVDVSVILEKEAYDVTFEVVDMNGAISGAQVLFMGDTLLTNDNGIAIFEKIAPVSDTTYQISKDGYYATSGKVSVVDAAVEVTVELKLITYMVNFTVVDADANAIEDAEILIEGISVTTDAAGKAMVQLAPVTDASYKVTKEGYTAVEGTVTVADADVDVDVELAKSTFSVTFTVVDKDENPIENAEVIMLEETLSTDINGMVVFLSVSPTTDIEYVVSAEGYQEASGLLSVVDADVELTVQLLAVGIKQDIALIGNIYPNPSYGEITISLKEAFNNAQLLIYNSNGQIVEQQMLTQLETKLDLMTSKSGIYLVKLLVDDQLYFGKIVINE